MYNVELSIRLILVLVELGGTKKKDPQCHFYVSVGKQTWNTERNQINTGGRTIRTIKGERKKQM